MTLSNKNGELGSLGSFPSSVIIKIDDFSGNLGQKSAFFRIGERGIHPKLPNSPFSEKVILALF